MKRLAPVVGLVALLHAGTLPAAPWLVFTEINYRSGVQAGGVQAGVDSFEFVELLNLEAPHVDLGGWQLGGKVRFRFPPGIRLGAGECLVVARDPRGLAERCPLARRIVGPFAGGLDDGGGRIFLQNPAGAVLAEMRYGRDGAWPAAADGTGHTLVLRQPFLDPTEPRSWAASTLPGGTPGVVEWGGGGEPQGELLVKKGDRWKFLRGNRAPPPDWSAPGAADSGWEEGPSGFGFADNDDATVIDDMVGSYLALYTRRTFAVGDPRKPGLLFLRVDYDDSFRAVLNGREVARGNLPPGVPITHRTPALGTREPGTVEVIPLGAAASLLLDGPNTLAVEVHNQSLRSSDLSLIVELERREAASEPSGAEASPVLNEVQLSNGSGGGWVEVHNPSGRSLSLGGWYLTDDPANLRKFLLPPGAVVPPRGFLSLSGAELGGGFSIGGPLVCLVPPGGGRVADALRRPPAPSGRARPAGAAGEGREESVASADNAAAVSFGRYPDGAPEVVPLGSPTPGLANRAETGVPVIIHELMYHPREADPSGEWVELHCRGSDAIDLGGYRLAGGIRFELPRGSRIAPGGFLVVAKDPARVARAHGLAAGTVVGPFPGGLSDGGDQVALLDPDGRTVDRVVFGDGHPWPEEADGGGPSLELVNPAADNSLPGAWSASDEAARAPWREYRYQKTLDSPRLVPPAFFQLMLIEEGACLVDDLVLEDDSGRAILRETFDGKAAEGWTAHGTHARSGVERLPDGGAAYLLDAGGRGNPRFNYVCSPALKDLRQGSTYTVSFRARWVRGSRLLLTRVSGQALAKTQVLEVPAAMGTPGRPNGRHREDWAPIVGTPRQHPVAPRSTEAVEVSVEASTRSPFKNAVLRYRSQGSPEWKEGALRPGLQPGRGVLQGTIPPQAAGMVEFYLSVTDSEGRTGTFPREAPERTALYAVGLEPRGRFPTFAILVSDREWERYRGRQRLSNLLLDATLVQDGSRIFYNVGLRPRGSPFTRSQGNWRVVLGAETVDGRGTLTLDAQGSGATNLNERLTYWLLDQAGAPTPRQRYVQVVFVGHREESGLYEDNDKIDGDFLDRWFPAASRREGDGERPPAPDRGPLHKVDDHWEMIPAFASRRSGFDLGRLFGGPAQPPSQAVGAQAYAEAFLKYRSEDPEDYRWNFTPRSTDGREDFAPLIKLIRLLDPGITDDQRFRAEVESVVDVDGWLRVLATRTIANDWDTIGRHRGKNAFLYLSPRDNRWHLLPWDSDLSWSQSFMNGRYALRSIYPDKFPEFVRILQEVGYRRRFQTYLAYLAGKMESGHLEGILRETRSRVGTSPQKYLTFAEFAVGLVRSELPSVPFRVDRSARVASSGEADLLRVSGTAPVLVHRFTLDGRAGDLSFEGGDEWTAEFPVGPEGGEATLLGLDPGGGEVVRAVLQVPARAGAAPLPVGEAEPEVVVIER